MPEKSIREMTKWERIHYSLAGKVFRITVLGAIILGLAAFLVGFGMYVYSLARQYIGLSFETARSAAAVLEQAVDLESMADFVLTEYRSLPESERLDPESEEYLAHFQAIESEADYQTLYAVLKIFRDSSSVNDVYMAYFDQKTQALVYMCDPDESEETGFAPGEWEEVEAREIERFHSWDGKGELYDISNTERYGVMCTSGVPVTGKNGEICAFILTDVTLHEVRNELISFLWQYTLVLSLVVMVYAILLTRHMKKDLVTPINRIADAAQSYVEDCRTGVNTGKHFAELKLSTGDELENLSLVMADMEQSLADYGEHLQRVTAERERINTELALATRIQADMMPNVFPAFPDRTDVDIYAYIKPAREVGGDFYDFFLIDDEHLCMIIGDVAGKGIPAALFMMAVKIILGTQVISGKSPAAVLEATNAMIYPSNREEMFATVWLGILDLTNGRLRAVSAGHEYPILRESGGEYKLLKDKHGFVVGALENVKYREYEIMMKPGTRLFVYTDGVPEAVDAQDNMFGTARMVDVLNQDPDASPETVLNSMQEAVESFAGEAPQFDDMTMMCIEYSGTDKT